MDNKERQIWLESKQEKEKDLYKCKRHGHFSYCSCCTFKTSDGCSTTKTKRLKENLCAKAYNKYIAN